MGHRILYIPKANSIFYPSYGLLYNWYAATDVRNIANMGWNVPLMSEYQALYNYLGTVGFQDKLKEANIEYWNDITDVTNSAKFNGRGAGVRDAFNGIFGSIKSVCWLGCINDTSWAMLELESGQHNAAITTSRDYKYGISIRLLSNTPATGLADGITGTYIGNDGKVYRTIVIDEKWWLAENLAETKYRNGDVIPWYGANQVNYFTNAEWAALTTAGCCAYNNDESNVAEGFSFPT